MLLPVPLLALVQHFFLLPKSSDPLIQSASYGAHPVALHPDPPALARRYFPEPALDRPLRAPFFLNGGGPSNESAWAAGLAGPTDSEQLDAFLRNVTASHPWATYGILGGASEEGRDIPYVRCSLGSDSSAEGKVRIWIQGGAHGNEPAGDQGVLAFLGALAAPDPEGRALAAHLLSRADLLFLPRYNPDGVAYFTRTLATGFDPNRDHVRLARRQTQAVKRLLNDFNPHVAIDAHEYSAHYRPTSSSEGSEGETGDWAIGSDGLFSAAKNLNIDSAIRALSEDLFAAGIARDLAKHNLTGDAYVTGLKAFKPGRLAFAEAGSEGRIGRNSVGLTQTVSFLLETRGIGLGPQHFLRRTATMRTMIASIVDSAVEHAEQVRKTVEGGRRCWNQSKEELVLRDQATTGLRDVRLCSPAKGRCESRQVEWHSTTPTKPVLTRARPAAYLIPRGWADVAERLRALGLQVETIGGSFEGEVEALRIASVALSQTYYEGAVHVTVETSALRETVTLPVGSFRISSAQQNFALAVVALEPESGDSYAATNLIPVAEGELYPVYRLLDD